MGFLEDAENFADQHDEQLDAGIEKAGDMIDAKTGDKYTEQIDRAQDFAEEKTGEGDTAQ